MIYSIGLKSRFGTCKFVCNIQFICHQFILEHDNAVFIVARKYLIRVYLFLRLLILMYLLTQHS